MTKESCSNRIRIALSIRNVKQVELCENTGIPKSAMSQYINGKFEPKQDRIWLIANALNVSEAWLMGYDVAMDRNNNINEQKETEPIQDKINLQEQSLIDTFRLLNEEGQEKAIEYINDLVDTGKYKKFIEHQLENEKMA